MYKKIVSQIQDLPWSTFDPEKIIYVSLFSAIEFAESLRAALRVFPENVNLQEMASGELNTANLAYGDYSRQGDHSQFLDYFCMDKQSGIYNRNYWKPKVALACINYQNVVDSMTDKEKAMTVFSREQELPGIFDKIRNAHDWEFKGFGFYKYYLDRHIELDSEEGGHANLVANFEMDDEVLLKFYKARLELYQSLAA